MPSALLWAYSAERIFLIYSSGKSADFPELSFHGWGRKGRWHICRLPCIPLCESRIQKRPQAFPCKNKNRGTQVVKLSVPFLFSSAHSAVPEPCVPRSGCRANQNAASCQEKESMEWRNGTERLQTLRFLVQRG